MTRDILAEMGYLALGSRLKRLAERMQADATKAFSDRGIPVQAAHFPLLAALTTYGPLSVTEAVEAVGISQPAVTRIHNSLQKLGLTHTVPVPGDNRQKQIRLTPEGEALVAAMKHTMWPHVRREPLPDCPMWCWAGPPPPQPARLSVAATIISSTRFIVPSRSRFWVAAID